MTKRKGWWRTLRESMGLLAVYGERWWVPWNIAFVWSYVRDDGPEDDAKWWRENVQTHL